MAAAESLLRERSFRELTVDEVMRRTDLSRPSFYVYFKDRHALILRVVEHLRGELRTMSQRWYTGAGDGPALAREAMEGIVEVYADAGPGAARAGRRGRRRPRGRSRSTAALVQSFIDVTTHHIEAEIEAGRVLPLDAAETARALVWMMERYLNRCSAASGRDAARDRRPHADDDLDARALRRRLTQRVVLITETVSERLGQSSCAAVQAPTARRRERDRAAARPVMEASGGRRTSPARRPCR